MAWRPPSGPRPPHYWGFEIILRHTTLGRTPLEEWSAPRRDLYMTTHNTHKRQTSTPLAEFEPAITADKLLQTHALDRAAAGFDTLVKNHGNFFSRVVWVQWLDRDRRARRKHAVFCTDLSMDQCVNATIHFPIWCNEMKAICAINWYISHFTLIRVLLYFLNTWMFFQCYLSLCYTYYSLWSSAY